MPTDPTVSELGSDDRGLSVITDCLFVVPGISGLVVGVQALFVPQYFYDEFPLGRGWVAMDPPLNEHLVRDVGAFNLALAAITFAAIAMRSPLAARLAALAWLVFSIPHGIFHAAHLHDMPLGDTIGLLVGTAGPAFLAVLVLVLVRPGSSWVSQCWGCQSWRLRGVSGLARGELVAEDFLQEPVDHWMEAILDEAAPVLLALPDVDVAQAAVGVLHGEVHDEPLGGSSPSSLAVMRS